MSAEINNGSTEQNQDVLRRVIEEGFNKGNYAALDPLFTTDYREHQFGLKTTLESLTFFGASKGFLVTSRSFHFLLAWNSQTMRIPC